MILHHGDCLEILKTIPDNSVDSLVTDPPAGISFMGKEWDSAKGGRKEWVEWMASVMRECLRVMKPGAHGLVWAIPRTSHWTATALEDAGFEVRDVITHLFGQGFPKSLDISKAIDKAAGAERKVVGTNGTRPIQTSGRINSEAAANGKFEREQNFITAPATDAAKQWAGWGTALKPAVERWILVKKPFISTAIDREICYSNALIGGLLCRLSPAKFAGLVSTLNPSASEGGQSASAQWLVAAFNTLRLTEPSELTAMFKSQAEASMFLSIASLWSGTLDALLTSGSTFTTETETSLTTALRTLNSLLSRTTDANTLQAGTSVSGSNASAGIAARSLREIEERLSEIHTLSALAIATERAVSLVPSIEGLRRNEYALQTGSLSEDFILVRKPLSEKTVAANVLEWGTGGINIDGCRIGTDSTRRPLGRKMDAFGARGDEMRSLGKIGGADCGRFPANLVLSHSPYCTDDQCDIECAIERLNGQSFGGDVPTGASRFFYCAKISTSERGQENNHPTVKPQKLMRYLCKLITPPNGIVLDPFMGSGSTGLAAKSEGFDFIGIEKELEYVEISKKRIGQ